MITAPAVSWRWRLAGLTGVVLFLLLIARFWHPLYGFTAFYQLDAANDAVKIPALRAAPVFVHRDTSSYDGLYYAQIAQDPTLRDPALPAAMDDFPYRARRILAPALAWLLGAGQPRAIIHAYSLFNVAAWLALAALLWRLLAVRDARGWLAWAGVLFSAGTLGSVRLALTDVLAVTLIAAALFAAERWRGRLAVMLLAASALARETAFLAVAGLCKPPWFSAKNVTRIVLAAAPLAAWLGYVRWRIGAGNPGWGNFDFPGAGLVGKLGDAAIALGTVADQPLAWSTFLATLAIAAQAAFILARPRVADRWWRVGAVNVALMFLLGSAVWEGFPGAATRVLLPLHLAFNILAHRTRAPLIWLLAGNLSVFSGLLALRDIPRDPTELVAQRLGDTVAVVRFENDWYGREESRRHVWLWTQQRGTLTVETIPPSVQSFRLEFALRSLAPRTVIVSHDGREITRAEVGPQLSHHIVTLLASATRPAKLEFSTDTPPVPEHTVPGSRPLAFALYDLRLALQKP